MGEHQGKKMSARMPGGCDYSPVTRKLPMEEGTSAREEGSIFIAQNGRHEWTRLQVQGCPLDAFKEGVVLHFRCSIAAQSRAGFTSQ
jgi:hypothetical protein